MTRIMENTKQCSLCSHYHSHDANAGECRLNPPTTPKGGGFGEWPGVWAANWCSKFKSKSDPSKPPGRPQLYTEDGLLLIVKPLLAGGPIQFTELHKLICRTTPMHGLTAKRRLNGLVSSYRLTLGESGYSLPVVEEDFS